MNYLSVCSGIEAASAAWHDLGWNPIGFSEIEKFPSQVLAHHYPSVPNLGDMTKYKEWQIDPIGLLVGGTPCQSFSVAGLRKGLEDPRGNLALTYVGILDRFRPKWFIWENVQGVLSSGNGRDFGAFLGAVAELGYGFAYRVLDAQNFGVAQRRRRVFVVGCLGDWESASKVLFESESLSGNIEKSKRTKQETSKYAGRGIATICPTIGCELAKQVNNQMVKNAEAFYIPEPVTYCIQGSTATQEVAQPICLMDQGGSVINTSDNGIVGTLRRETHGHEPSIVQNMAVRRLTPVECERLQGFPDDYTNIPSAADTNRYKALGNSMAVPVMRWIGKRIEIFDKKGDE